MNLAVKMVAEDGDTYTIEGLAAPFGGPFGGKDLSRQFFSTKTDFALDWFPERPLIWEHGVDGGPGLSPIGRVTSWEIKADLGLWAKAQLDKSSAYWSAIKKLIDQNKLFFSTSSIEHLTQASKSGEILIWPWTELTVTTHPCNPLATLDVVRKHFDMAGIKSAKLDELDVADDSTVLNAAKAAVKDLPDGPTMMADADDSGPYPEGSYEDLADDIKQTMCKLMGCYCYVSATFPGYALVVCSDEDEGTKYVRVAYTLDAEGEPVLGDMESVTLAMVPLPTPQTDEAPLAIQSARLSDYAELVTDRTKGINDRRIKEGRVLSTANRERLVASADALEEALKSMRDLLETTEPQPAQAASVDRISSFALLKLWSEATSD